MQEQLIKNTEPTEKISEKKEKCAVNKVLIITKQIIAILFWLYILIKLFVFDIDIFIVNKFFPEYVRFLDYKFFFFIGVISLIWLVTKNKHILSWLFYILFYPVIIFFWKIPFFIFKQRSWTLAFAFINTIFSFFKSIKYTFILFSLYTVSTAIIFIFTNKIMIWPAMLVILLITITTYVHRFILIFKPSSVFQLYTLIFSKIRTHGVKSSALFMLDEDIKTIPFDNLNDRQLEKWTTTLQISVLYNRICLFVAKKFKDYQSSRLNVVYYVFGILALIILTVLSFAIINYGLFKIDINQFSYIKIPTFFTFFYSSFNNLLFNDIQEISRVLPISQAISMIESFLALILIGIFASLLISVRGEKHNEELNKVIQSIETQGAEMEYFIQEEYKITNIHDAILELEKVKAGMVKLIYTISNNIK